MSKTGLKIISDAMSELGINYEYMQFTSEPVYPYFTGEYQEVETPGEHGEGETQFILNGFTRGSFLELEDAKEKIERYFPSVGGKTVIADNGSAVAVFYANTFSNIPTGDAELKRIQINLTVKEWKVI